MEKIVLASSSPRRRELMARAGFRFEVIVSEADENIEVEAPDRMVEELSKRKAGAVAELVKTQGFAEDSVLIVGADTMVSIDGKKLGKPAGEAGAEAMLKELGLTHKKHTTDDMLFTVETVSCLGACGLAPTLTVNDEVHPKMTPEKAVELLNELRGESV